MDTDKVIRIEEWFDVDNPVHLEAYLYLHDNGEWPKDFLPKSITFGSDWVSTINRMLAITYILEQRGTTTINRMLAITYISERRGTTTVPKENHDLAVRLSEIVQAFEVESSKLTDIRSNVNSLFDDLEVLKDELGVFNDDIEIADNDMCDGLCTLEDAIEEIKTAIQSINDI
jgi:hypothetical protein